MMRVALLSRRAVAACGRSTGPCVGLNVAWKAPLAADAQVSRRALSSGSQEPLGLRQGVDRSGMSPTMRMLLGYISVGLAAMATIARYKARDEVADESVRVFNMAKRAVVKDRRVFEAVGYPKEFEKITSYEDDASDPVAAASAGSFRVVGDKGTLTVAYRKQQRQGDGEAADDSSDSDPVRFELLQVTLPNGDQFSALESFMQDESVVTHKKSESLGKKLLFPVIGGVVIGGVSSFFVIRILRNRPFYVHKLVLDHVNNHDLARQWLGHPIKSNRKDYVGSLTHEAANYTITCRGPKGEGTLIVKAFKKESDDATAEASNSIMATPGTSWKFSTLVLSVPRNEKRKEKNAKTINLLASGSAPDA